MPFKIKRISVRNGEIGARIIHVHPCVLKKKEREREKEREVGMNNRS
jgi:hypothetical protein